MASRRRNVADSQCARSAGVVRAVVVSVLLSAALGALAEKKPERPAGAEHTCAAVAGGGVRCWGSNHSGQLGDGTYVNRNAPVAVAGLTAAVSVIAAGSEHTCAVIGGGLACWGANFSGQLGDGTHVNRNAPVAISGLGAEVTAVSAGGEHTCAVAARRVKCWGSNASGQLGDGTDIDRNAPVDVKGLPPDVVAIASGAEHACALTARGAVWCWGTNFSGQLGDGTHVNRNAPVNVAGLAGGVAAIAAGAEHTCALSAAGAVSCWGANFSGQLGDGSNVNRNVPVAVLGFARGVTDIAAGAEHTCAVIDGGVACWGTNASGQLGDDTNASRNRPTEVAGLSGRVDEITVGSEHSCALTQGGAIACWGANFSGQLGDASNINQKRPVNVPGLPTVSPSVRVRIL